MLAIDKPAFGKVRVSNELKKQGLLVSPGDVRSVWLRQDLEVFAKRLKALEAKTAQEGLILTEDQVKALEEAQQEKEAHGEIETMHSGYLGAQTRGVSLRRRSQIHDEPCKGRVLRTVL